MFPQQGIALLTMRIAHRKEGLPLSGPDLAVRANVTSQSFKKLKQGIALLTMRIAHRKEGLPLSGIYITSE
jgi:hypothetical protein